MTFLSIILAAVLFLAVSENKLNKLTSQRMYQPPKYIAFTKQNKTKLDTLSRNY